jgi:hypothetical protein
MNPANKLFLFVIIPLMAFAVHKYYISLTKIDFIENEKMVQITMRFFINDIENTLENRYGIKLELDTENENIKVNVYLEKYIASKFKVIINENVKTLTFIGKEYENDVIYFYLEIPDIETIKKIEVQNKMLFEEFPEQENYVKFNINQSNKTFVLRKENDKEMLNF